MSSLLLPIHSCHFLFTDISDITKFLNSSDLPSSPDYKMTSSSIPSDSPAHLIFESILRELDAASGFKELIYEDIAGQNWLLLSESLASHPEVERRRPR